MERKEETEALREVFIRTQYAKSNILSSDKITGLPFRTKGKTFVGSIRDKFTGPRRNNFQTITN